MANPPDDRETADAMNRMEAEPLLRIEKQLIAGSLLLGLLLLGLLWWVSARYFPADGGPAVHQKAMGK